MAAASMAPAISVVVPVSSASAPSMSISGALRPLNMDLGLPQSRGGSVRFLRSPAGRSEKRSFRGGAIAVRADSSAQDKPEQSKEILDAFFVGKALGDTITERLGTAVGEALGEITKWDAERRKATKDFQEEVTERAKDELVKRTKSIMASSPSSSSPSSNFGSPPAGSPVSNFSVNSSSFVQREADLRESVDGLRAEIARTRAEVQRLKRSELFNSTVKKN